MKGCQHGHHSVFQLAVIIFHKIAEWCLSSGVLSGFLYLYIQTNPLRVE